MYSLGQVIGNFRIPPYRETVGIYGLNLRSYITNMQKHPREYKIRYTE